MPRGERRLAKRKRSKGGIPVRFLGELPAPKTGDMKCRGTDTECRTVIAGGGAINPEGVPKDTIVRDALARTGFAPYFLVLDRGGNG